MPTTQNKPVLSEKRIMNYEVKTVSQALAVMIQKAFVLAGQTPGIDDMRVMVRELTADLALRYKTLTLDEVQYAIENGVRNAYGDYFGINVVTVNKWLSAYCSSMQRQRVLQAAIPDVTQKTLQLSDSEKDTLLQQAAGRCYDRYCKTGVIRDFGNAVYDYLDAANKLQLTPRQKEQFYHQARCRLIAGMRTKLAKEGGGKFNSALNNLLHNPEAEHQRIVSLAKRLALEDYFKRLK